MKLESGFSRAHLKPPWRIGSGLRRDAISDRTYGMRSIAQGRQACFFARCGRQIESFGAHVVPFGRGFGAPVIQSISAQKNDFVVWLETMARGHGRLSDRKAAVLLGISRRRVKAYRVGSPLPKETALACSALVNGLPPWRQAA